MRISVDLFGAPRKSSQLGSAKSPACDNMFMATNRLEALKQMVAQDPKNSFARYGLAMELSNSNMPSEAVAEFKTLMANDGTYVAAYFHCGQALEKLGKIDEARNVYERGIEACSTKGDAHTRAEIEAALSLLPI